MVRGKDTKPRKKRGPPTPATLAKRAAARVAKPPKAKKPRATVGTKLRKIVSKVPKPPKPAVTKKRKRLKKIAAGDEDTEDEYAARLAKRLKKPEGTVLKPSTKSTTPAPILPKKLPKPKQPVKPTAATRSAVAKTGVVPPHPAAAKDPSDYIPRVKDLVKQLYTWIPGIEKEVKDCKKDLDDCRTDYAELAATEHTDTKQLDAAEQKASRAIMDKQNLEQQFQQHADKTKAMNIEFKRRLADARAKTDEARAAKGQAVQEGKADKNELEISVQREYKLQNELKECKTELKTSENNLDVTKKFVMTTGALAWNKAKELKECKEDLKYRTTDLKEAAHEIKRCLRREAALEAEKRKWKERDLETRTDMKEMIKHLPPGVGRQIIRDRNRKTSASARARLARTP